MSASDQDDQIDRYTDALAQLRELMPLVEKIDAVVADIVPRKPGRGRCAG